MGVAEKGVWLRFDAGLDCAPMEERPYKIVLAGKHHVGKSSIFRKLQNIGDTSSGGMYTIETGTGVSNRKNREKWMVHMHSRNGEITVILWDTGGMERHGHYNMTQSYYVKSRAVILVYDTGDRASLNELSDWIEAARDCIRERSTIFSLWGNDTGNDINPVEEDAVTDFAQKHGIARSLIFNVSASTGDNLLDSLKQVVDAVHLTVTNPGQANELYQLPYVTLRGDAEFRANNACWKSCCNL